MAHRVEWHPEEIKAAIRRTGITLSDLARRKSLSPTTVHAALRRCQPRGNRAISSYLGVPVHELWPQFFEADGSVRPGAHESRAEYRRAQRQKAKTR